MEGVEWVVREEWGQGGEMTQVLYAHMNNKIKKKNTELRQQPPSQFFLVVVGFELRTSHLLGRCSHFSHGLPHPQCFFCCGFLQICPGTPPPWARLRLESSYLQPPE
jgi:hypothetical protein